MNVRPRAVSNCGGFGENDTGCMPLAAVPASSRPGLRLARGSLVLGYVCADARAGATAVAMRPISFHELRKLRIESDSGGGCGGTTAATTPGTTPATVHLAGSSAYNRCMMPIS